MLSLLLIKIPVSYILTATKLAQLIFELMFMILYLFVLSFIC